MNKEKILSFKFEKLSLAWDFSTSLTYSGQIQAFFCILQISDYFLLHIIPFIPVLAHFIWWKILIFMENISVEFRRKCIIPIGIHSVVVREREKKLCCRPNFCNFRANNDSRSNKRLLSEQTRTIQGHSIELKSDEKCLRDGTLFMFIIFDNNKQHCQIITSWNGQRKKT